MKSVGDRIRQARAYRRLSADALAKIVGYKTQSGISNLEARSTGSGGRNMAGIAAALNFPVAWLLNGPDLDDLREIDPALRAPSEHAVRDPQLNAWGDAPLRAQISALIAMLNAEGLQLARQQLETLAAQYPRSYQQRAGDPVPAPRRQRA